MPASFNFIVCHHSIDGMRLALQSFPETSTKRLVLLSRDSSSAPLFLGHYCPPEYSGLAGLFQYDPETLAVKHPFKDESVYVVFPSTAEANRPASEILDRLKIRLANWGSVNVVLFYQQLPEDLPAMTPADQLICLWEVRDTPSEKDLETFTYLNERIKKEKPKFHGLKFYGRIGIEETSLQSSLNELQSLTKNQQLKLLRL